MSRAMLCAGLLTASCLAEERVITVRDEEGLALAGVRIEAILTPTDDPRLASVVLREGTTDPDGSFRFAADERLVLARVKARRTGHHTADADHRHGLGRSKSSIHLSLTLPQLTELVPLNYREIHLSGLPTDKWIGFDAEIGDAIGPYGKGKTTDFNFRIESQQVGWAESAEALAELRLTAEGRRMDAKEWAETYGRFRGTLHLSFPRPADGIQVSPAFWPYCMLKMPALAPADGYAQDKSFAFDTLPDGETAHDFTGTYLRLRTQVDPRGLPVSAHYAKIHGRIETGPGRVAFRFYYNPRADDRRLAFAPGRNLLRPGPKEPAHHFETQQP